MYKSMYNYDYTPKELTALFAEANRLKGKQKYPKPQPGQSLLDAQPPAGGATFNLPPAPGPADVVNAPVDIAPRKGPPIGYQDYLKETQQNRKDPFITETRVGDIDEDIPPGVIERLKASQGQPDAQPGAQPGLLSRLGRGLVGALKGGVKEGLSAIKLGSEGYKTLQLQKELLPLQKELARERAGTEQTQADRDFADRKALIEYQQQQEKLYATPQATPKLTTGDLERQYLESLSPEERNAVLKRRLTPTKSLQEQIDELTAQKPPSSPAITTPATPTVPTMTPTVPAMTPEDEETKALKAMKNPDGTPMYTDDEIKELLALMPKK